MSLAKEAKIRLPSYDFVRGLDLDRAQQCPDSAEEARDIFLCVELSSKEPSLVSWLFCWDVSHEAQHLVILSKDAPLFPNGKRKHWWMDGALRDRAYKSFDYTTVWKYRLPSLDLKQRHEFREIATAVYSELRGGQSPQEWATAVIRQCVTKRLFPAWTREKLEDIIWQACAQNKPARDLQKALNS